MSGYALYAVLVGAVVIQRLVEVAVSRRNAAWTLRQGGVEFGGRHFPLLVVLHVGLLAGCLGEPVLADRPFIPLLGWPMFGLVVAAGALRWWCVATLGRRWNHRIIVVPGRAPVARGSYRYLRHPNYLAVVVEGLALPLVHSAWITATAFTLVNLAVLLLIRIPREEHALTWAASAERLAPR
ncbi:isoprenylcysteine carboxyl methyltransferase family protein [Actinopolymorpha alba]|uniref:isoprenylcysteine carboxyl methyltransferase family protein n=1 Tax=Actinopolymorpha alba TaxID=533267 RepID=UPI00035D1520|nr:isoprenylcysteine carboxylmethyltransferase family protein [Actinopolymorpha alba]